MKTMYKINRVRPNLRFLDPLIAIMYMTTFSTIFNKISIYLGRFRHFQGRALWLGQARGPSAGAGQARGPSVASSTR